MFRIIMVWLVVTISSSAFASSFDRGLNHYRTSNFVQAKVEFQNALRAGSNRSGYGKIYKYLGLSQYMLGEKKEAKASFGYALHYNPKVELYPNEVLDSSVLEFFLEVKQKEVKQRTVRSSPSKGAKRSVASKVKPKPVPVAKPNKSTAGTSRKPKRVIVSKRPAAKRDTDRTAANSGKTKARNTANKSASKAARARVVAKKQQPRRTAPVAKNKKRQNMFSAKKPPKVIILDNSGNNAKKMRNKPRHKEYQDLLPIPTSKSRSVRVGGGVSAWSFLPFGAGQYAAGRYKLGHLFAIGSVGALVSAGIFYWAFWEQDNKYIRTEGQLKSCIEGKLAQCMGEENRKITERELRNSLELMDSDVFLNSIGIWSSVGGFGLLWIGGIVESVVNRPLPIKYVYYDGDSVALAFNYQL